jgi:antitoxin component YwqK of YwqJK toxin-antitoxin module
MPDPSLPRIESSTFEDIGPVRIQRKWHHNGQLIKEIKLKQKGDNYVLDGASTQWSSDGELIGTSTFNEGTGVFRDWYDNGQLFGEISIVEGLRTGLQRGWDETGYLLVEQFWYRNQQVSKKKYRELQAVDASIPQYEPEAFQPISKKRQ